MTTTKQPRQSDILVTGDWLEANLSDSALRIIDARKCEGYLEAHIPGAVRISLRPFLREDGDVISSQAFAAGIKEMGVSNDTPVVVYDDGSNLFAARLWFVLNYYGHHDVRVLDGGWDGWKADGRIVNADAHVPDPATFSARPEAGWIVDTDYVAQSIGQPDRIILDTRSIEEWGRLEQTGETAPGHIPGATHLFWSDTIDPATHRFLAPDVLGNLFAQAGLRPEQEIITYCHAGIRAAHSFFALRLAGFARVKNYEGSWIAWAKSGQPVVLAA